MARPKKVETASITWLGEDGLHEDGHGPSTNVWNGITFPKNRPVEVSIPHMIAKARKNQFYAVGETKVSESEAE